MPNASSRRTKARFKRRSRRIFALPFADPLWQKFDDAHRDRDIPSLLAGLSKKWDGHAANALFWDCLCHQDTCYGATYATIPHLLNIGATPPSQEALEDIAAFLGHVSRVAYEPEHACACDKTIPQGLQTDLAGWDKTLAPYRSTAEHTRNDLADPAFPKPKRPEKGRLTPEQLAALHGSSASLDALIPEDQEEAMQQAQAEMRSALQPASVRVCTQERLAHATEILARPRMTEADLAK
ncbi:MAG: hypothetical protein AAFY59_09430, partial [Pseudomonadota bacterium]